MRNTKASSTWAALPGRSARATARSRSRSSRKRLASVLAGERPISTQVPERGSPLAEVLVDAGKVVVRVRAGRIPCNRELVGGDRFRTSSQVLERDAEIESGGGVVGATGEGAAVVVRGALRVARFVHQPAEVHVRIRVSRIELERPRVRLRGCVAIGFLEIAAALEEVVCGRVGGLAREGRDPPRQLRGAEVEQDLAVLGAPPSRAVSDDDPIAFGADVHVAEGSSLGELVAEPRESPFPPP